MSETEAVPMETTTNEANGTAPEVEMKSETTGAEGAAPEVEMKQASEDGSVLGVDFGSQTCVASVALKGQGLPVLVPNNLSNLSTPNVVSFRPDERVIGEEAANRMISDAQSTVSLTKLLLGKRFSELDPEFVSKTLPYKLVRGGADNDTVLIKVNYGEEEKDSLFTVPHVSAMMLKELVHYTAKYISNKTPVPPKKVVIAIPSSWGPREKRAIVDAAKIAGLEVLSLISENTAVALAYGFTHDLEENAAPKNFAVVNLGHQFFAVQVVQYTHQKLKVLSSTCDSGLGGGVVDQRLVQHFSKEFQERYKVDAQSNVKARTRLMRACEKAKKVLSTIPETDLELDCLMDDIFVKGKITRTALEELMQDQLAKMKELIHQALNSAGLKPEDISEVEIVGGGVRIPAVQSAISEAFGGKELSKHIDGSSAVAEGAAIFASILTPGFDFVYNVEDSFMEQREAEEGLNESELQEAIEREKVMDEKDRIRHETAAAKNHLETQLYDLRDKVGNDKFAAQIGSKKDELLSLLQKTEDWLYGDEEGQGDHPNTNKDHFEAKLQEIKNEIEKISPEFHQHLIQLQEQKEREIAAAAAERERLASQPSVSSRDKTEKPLTKKEKFEAAKKRKNQGNICFKDGDFEGAVSRYVGAVTLADEIIDSVTEEEKKELLEVKISSFLNIAICCLKVHNDAKAIDMCKKVLELDPNNVKALFRRAHALRNTKEYELALADLLKAQKIEPQNTDVNKAIVQVKKLIEDEKARQKMTYAKMFS